MPQIPLTEGYRIAPENPGTQEQFHNIRPNVQATENWGRVGSGLAGGLAVHVGAAMEKAIDDADRTQALTLANELRKRASEFTYGKNGKGGYLNEKGVNALNGNLPEVFGDRLTKATEEIGKKANVRARKYFNQYAARINQGFHDGIDRHIYKESVAVEAASRTDAHNLDTQDIMQATGREDYEAGMAGIEMSAERVREFAAKDGVKPDYSKVVGNQVLMMASMMMEKNADYKTVQGFVTGAKASGYLSDDQALRLSKAVKSYVLDKKTDDLADKAFARFANNEAAGMEWISKQRVSSDPDDNAVATRKLAERYNAQDRIVRASREQASERFERAYLQQVQAGNLYPDPSKLDGWQGLSPSTQAVRMFSYKSHVVAQQRARMGGGGRGRGGGGGGGTGDDRVVSGIPLGDGKFIPLTKRDVEDMRDNISSKLMDDDARAILGQQDFTGVAKGVEGILGIKDGTPWASYLDGRALKKLQDKLSSGISERAKLIREEAQNFYIDNLKMDEKSAKALALAVASNADDIVKQNAKLQGTKDWDKNLFVTQASRGEFIREQAQQYKTKTIPGLDIPYGSMPLALIQAQNKKNKSNAVIGGMSENGAERVGITSAPLADPGTLAYRRRVAFRHGIYDEKSDFRAWATSIKATGQEISNFPLTSKQKQILSAVNSATGRVDVSKLPNAIYKVGVDKATKGFTDKYGDLSPAQARALVSDALIASAVVTTYFPPVTSSTSAGAVTNTETSSSSASVPVVTGLGGD